MAADRSAGVGRVAACSLACFLGACGADGGVPADPDAGDAPPDADPPGAGDADVEITTLELQDTEHIGTWGFVGARGFELR